MFWYWFFGILAAGVLVCVFVLLRGRTLRAVEYTVTVQDLPPSFDGFRIAVISDLHDRCFGPENQRLSRFILAQNPEIVVCAGDMHEAPCSPEPFYGLLSAVSTRIPLFYTEGNHDVREKTPDFAEEYRAHLLRISQTGAVILNDASYPIRRGKDSLILYGQAWASAPWSNGMELDVRSPSVLVCHSPLQFDHVTPLPDVMISGHVHGGILRLPWIGPIFCPRDGAPLEEGFFHRHFFPKYSRGLYRKGNHTLAVTQGLGFCLLPIRFIPGEVMVLTLRGCEKTNNL